MNEYLINCKLSLLLEVFSQCIDYFDALDHEVKRNVACPLVTDDPSKYSRRALSSYENESKIQITEFKSNNATEEICNKVKDTILIAGKFISKTFILKSPIFLSVNYTNLCIVQSDLCKLQGGKVVVIGFTSNWQNWFLTGNKNQILITSKPDVVISDNEVIFDEFKETAFDNI
ncbi:unnamed protein product [Rhizophagus irregularis]|nr:unnamed protein product [Rhizophagus irregularis]